MAALRLTIAGVAAPSVERAAPNAIDISSGPMRSRSCAVRRRHSMFFQKIANAGGPATANSAGAFAARGAAVAAIVRRVRIASSRRARSADASIAASSNAASVRSTHAA